MSDRIDQIARSLQNIEQYLANSSLGGSTGIGTLDPNSYVIKETDDLDGVDDGGTVTLQPGEEKTIVEARANSADGNVLLYAAGAVDKQDVTYVLVIDDKKAVGGRTNSPLGTLNNPFSFAQVMNAAVPAERYIEYRALNVGSGSVDLSGRLHVEVE